MTLDMSGGGTLSVREDGLRVYLEARREPDGLGLYKVWLTGQGAGAFCWAPWPRRGRGCGCGGTCPGPSWRWRAAGP